ncbi:MAG: hypothetical protein WC755_02070 [Candidatus Woesearchaeota archaeon]|jgi:hypothetical protein
MDIENVINIVLDLKKRYKELTYGVCVNIGKINVKYKSYKCGLDIETEEILDREEVRSLKKKSKEFESLLVVLSETCGTDMFYRVYELIKKEIPESDTRDIIKNMVEICKKRAKIIQDMEKLGNELSELRYFEYEKSTVS